MGEAERKALYQRMARTMWAGRKAKMDASWDERAKGLTPGDAARTFYKVGYQAAWRAKRQGRKCPKEFAA